MCRGRLLILSLFFGLLEVCLGQNQDTLSNKEEFDFRKVRWGMSKLEVKQIEKSKFSQELSTTDILAYEGEVGGLSCYIAYIFFEGKLSRGKYLFTAEHTNKNAYISDFESIDEILREKYGPPTEKKVLWLNDLYKDEYDDWGFAVSLGHLTYYSSYETERTDITMLLRGENYDISHGVEYLSKEIGSAEMETTKKKKSEDF